MTRNMPLGMKLAWRKLAVASVESFTRTIKPNQNTALTICELLYAACTQPVRGDPVFRKEAVLP